METKMTEFIEKATPLEKATDNKKLLYNNKKDNNNGQ